MVWKISYHYSEFMIKFLLKIKYIGFMGWGNATISERADYVTATREMRARWRKVSTDRYARKQKKLQHGPGFGARKSHVDLRPVIGELPVLYFGCFANFKMAPLYSTTPKSPLKRRQENNQSKIFCTLLIFYFIKHKAVQQERLFIMAIIIWWPSLQHLAI